MRLGGSQQQCSLTAKSSSGPETPALRCWDLAGGEQTQGPSWAGPGRTEDQGASRQAVWSGILSGFQAPAMETTDRRWKAKQKFSASVLHVQGPNLLPAFQFSFFVRDCFILSRAQFKQCGYVRFFCFQVLVLQVIEKHILIEIERVCKCTGYKYPLFPLFHSPSHTKHYYYFHMNSSRLFPMHVPL